MNTPYDLAIVGGGLSALSAIKAGLPGERVIILDYQEAPGGFLRHALPSPGFERPWELIRSAQFPPNVTVCFGTTAVGLLPAFEENEAHTLVARAREGTRQLSAWRILIACGGLEVTREYAQIPGSRPTGVMTPIQVHQLLARGYLPGRRALVYGDSRYTIATAQRLRRLDVEVIMAIPGESELLGVHGFPRLDQVTLRQHGEARQVTVDLLVYSAGMMANTHWLKGSGVQLASNGAIAVDANYRTNVPGIYAIGTVLVPSLDHADSLHMGKEVASLLTGGSQ